jgi:uncharacterized membrane protein
MTIAWTDPSALWLLLAVPLVWLAGRFTRTNFNGSQRRLQTTVRSLLLVLLALALARPVVSVGSSRQSIVYAVDVSHSISSRAIEDAAAKIDEFNRTLRPDHWRIVAFGTTAASLETTDALRQLAPVDSSASSRPVDRRGTDLEAALAAAQAELAPGHVPRVVLFSDGRPTAGDLEAAEMRLAAEHIPVSVEPLFVRDIGDTWIDRIDLPEKITAGATFTAAVAIESQRSGPAAVELRAGSRLVARQDVLVSRGTTTVTLDGTFDAPGAQVLRATVSAPGDPLTVNNALDRAVTVAPRSRVLYVEGVAASAHYLAGALGDAGYEVSVRAPSALPSTAAALDPWDVVVLSDVNRKNVSDASMAALGEWVEKTGGGLLVAGGESVFGENGYRKTELERLTPVTFERRDEPEVALIIVLDRSWSMAGTSMDLCKAAAQAAVDVMTDEQSVGVLTFNDQFVWDVTLRNVGRNRDFIRKKIAAIEAAGHTLIYPAVEQAYLALRSVKARAKHVVLLSDGRSYPDDYEGLVKKMVDAHMTVSSIAVGPAADGELLGNIAKWGKGRAYVVQDAREVPQIFVTEAKNAKPSAFDEKAVTPIVKTPAFLASVDLTHLPALKGRTATVIKDGALEVLTTNDGDPLLAFWPIGLGRTAVFASDVKDRWAADWVKWRGYGPFFAAVVRSLERQRPAPMSLDVSAGPIHGNARSVAIAVEARDPGGRYRDLLRPVAEVRTGKGVTSDVSLRQVAPGRYEASVLADATDSLTVSLAGEDNGAESRLVLPDPAAEYRFRAPDEAVLRSIATTTGGNWQPTAASLSNAAGDRRIDRRPLWPALVVLALVLWFVDLLLRRVRVFEPVVQA